jgi:hypothetical protein
MADRVIAVGRDGAVTSATARRLGCSTSRGRPADSAEWARRHDLRSLGADGMDVRESPFTRRCAGRACTAGDIVVAVRARAGAATWRDRADHARRPRRHPRRHRDVHDVTARNEIERVRNVLVLVVSHELRTRDHRSAGRSALASGAYASSAARGSLVGIGCATPSGLTRSGERPARLEKVEAGRLEMRRDASTSARCCAMRSTRCGRSRSAGSARGGHRTARARGRRGPRLRSRWMTNLLSNAISSRRRAPW